MERSLKRFVGAGAREIALSIALSKAGRYDSYDLQILLRESVGGLRLSLLKPELPESPGLDKPN